MLLLNRLPPALHRRLYRVAHATRRLVWRVWRPRVHGVRVLALDDAGRVLLVRHSYGSPKWMPPGGGLGRHEDPLAAGMRELVEETGMTLVAGRHAVSVAEDLHGASNLVHIVIGKAQGVLGIDGREIVEAAFFALDDLPAAMPAGLADGLARWLSQHP